MAENSIQNLWPERISTTEQTPPVVILRQQATMLGQRTRNVLIGEVKSQQSGQWSDVLYHNFYVKAPALGGYRFKLFFVTQKVASLYPVMAFSDAEAAIPNEVQLEEALRSVFASEKAPKKLIQSLMAQSLTPTTA